MQFIVNGVIRSLTMEEKNNELKLLLLGRKLKSDSEKEFTIVDLAVSSHSVTFYGNLNSYSISKVKKIEIDNKENRIRVVNNKNHFIIPTI